MIGSPHFEGGKLQIHRYFKERKWTLSVPSDALILFAPCQSNIPPDPHVPLLSMAPQEHQHALKIPFFKAIKALFKTCDYRTFHPESYVVESVRDCLDVSTILEEQRRQVWFLKSARASFGDGIAVRTGDAALRREFRSCDVYADKNKRVLVQKGVNNIMQYNGRNTQGRSYLFISSYNPVSVWFFMGYFNIAGSNKTVRDIHITNLRSNQHSTRLLFHELMKGRTTEDMLELKNTIKSAALPAFLALKEKLGTNKGSFSLFGFDFLVEESLKVKVLEVNCNCELFMDEQKYGKVRVMQSTRLVDNMIDIVLTSAFDPKGFLSIL